MKHIAIAGSTSNLTRYLLKDIEQKYRVTLIGRKNADILWDLAENKYDIALPNDVDVLICIASAIKTTDDYEINNLMQVNVQGMLNLCIAAKRNNIKYIIYISSIYALLTIDDFYYNFYSMSKRHAEECLELYCKTNNLRLCILRPSQIYGDDDMICENQKLLYTMIRNARNNQDITIYGKNDALKNFIYVEDVVRVIVRTVESEIQGKYNVICLQNYRLSQIAKAINKIWEGKGRVIFLPDKGNIADNSFSDEGTIFRLLELPEPLGIYDGLREVRKAEV